MAPSKKPGTAKSKRRRSPPRAAEGRSAVARQRAGPREASPPRRPAAPSGGARAARGTTGNARQVRVLHHQGDRRRRGSAPSASAPSRAEVYTVHYKDIAAVDIRHADRGAGRHARERARPRAGQRGRDAQPHGHPDVVRHRVQDPGGHRRAPARRLRGVHRRARQDGRQARVRAEALVGSRRGRARGGEGRRGSAAA